MLKFRPEQVFQSLYLMMQLLDQVILQLVYEYDLVLASGIPARNGANRTCVTDTFTLDLTSLPSGVTLPTDLHIIMNWDHTDYIAGGGTYPAADKYSNLDPDDVPFEDCRTGNNKLVIKCSCLSFSTSS